MVTRSGTFDFGKMSFTFVYEDGETMPVAEFYVTGNTPEAQNALTCDRFSEAVYDFVLKNIMMLSQ